MVNPNVEQYKIAGAMDVPEIDVVIVPVWDGVNNTHSVGIGEPSTVATAAAIANAVSHAIGARIRQLPITPEVGARRGRRGAPERGGRMKPFALIHAPHPRARRRSASVAGRRRS